MIYWSEDQQTWMWDRWMCGNGTPLREWTAVHLHFHDGDRVRESDLPRLQEAKAAIDCK